MVHKDHQSSDEYGTNLRAQVFELIVKQALNGAKWQDICASSMQANKITTQEIIYEVNKRTLPPTSPASGAALPRPSIVEDDT